MIRNNLIDFISSKLSIDKKYIDEDTKIDLLCILSDYMNSLADEQKNELIISKEGLKKVNLQYSFNKKMKNYLLK